MAARRVGAYAKLLSNYASDDAIIAAGESAELLFVRGLAFCSTSDSDGYITDGQLVRVVGAGMKDATRRAVVLVREGLWERVDGGYVVRSWLKIHEAAEEKGRKRRTDRDRKRRERDEAVQSESEQSPSGQEPRSERIPEDVTLDSLDCSYVSSPVGTIQPKAIQSSSAQPSGQLPETTAQTLIAEWIEHCPKRPPGAVIGPTSKHLRQMLDEGIDPADVRAGLALWASKGLNPSALPSCVNEVMNRQTRGTSRDQQATNDLFARSMDWAIQAERNAS